MVEVRRVFLDIEILYTGKFEDRNQLFKDYDNWKFFHEFEEDGISIIYEGIIGFLVMNCDYDKYKNSYTIKNKKFVQLMGNEITRDNLMRELGEFDEIIHYHGRSTPNHNGYTGFDLPIINAQLGVLLDTMPGVNSIDIELLCHQNRLYGGLKVIERKLGIGRSSGVEDGNEANRLLIEAGKLKDGDEKNKLILQVLEYNKEDIRSLIQIEQILKLIKYVE